MDVNDRLVISETYFWSCLSKLVILIYHLCLSFTIWW